jgi:hypothetical protein
LEHYADGRLSLFDGHVYNILLAQADFRSGLWRGNVWTLENFVTRDVSRKSIDQRLQDCLRRLEAGGYIALARKQGQKTYTIYLNKYETGDGHILNAEASAACGKPVFLDEGEDTGEERVNRGSDEGDASVSDLQLGENGEVAFANNSITQKVKNSRTSGSQVGTPPAPSHSGSGCEAQVSLARFMYEVFFEYKDKNEATLNLMIKDAAKVLETRSYDQAQAALSFAKKSGWWFRKFMEVERPMALLAKSIDSILEQAQERKNRPVPQAKSPAEEAKARVGREVSTPKPGVADAMKFFNQAKKEH